MIIVGTQIRSLSAARYFAARLAELIVFDPSLCNAESIPKMKEIMGWIDGVEWALELGPDESALEFICDETGIQSVVTAEGHSLSDLTQITKYPSDSGFNASRRCIVAVDGSLPTSCEGMEIYRELDSEHLDKGLLQGIDGIVVRAPQESQVGLTDFEEADIILDWLEDAGVDD